jgi:hypothetical protein
MAKKSGKDAAKVRAGGPGTGPKFGGGSPTTLKASARVLPPGGGGTSPKAPGAPPRNVGGGPTTFTFEPVGGPGTTFTIEGDKTVTRIAAQLVDGKIVLTLT